MRILTALLLLAACPAWAAEIHGPASAPLGSPVVLTVSTGLPQCVWLLGNEEPAGTTLEVANGGRAVIVRPGGVGRYRILAVSASATSIETAEHILTVGQPGPGPTPVPPGPTPPTPPDPPEPPPRPEGFAGKVFDAASKVDSSTRKAEALKLATVHRDIAARAAGLSTMTPADMTRETLEQYDEALTDAELDRWDVFSDALAGLLRERGLKMDDREGHIAAWNEIASGLEAVR